LVVVAAATAWACGSKGSSTSGGSTADTTASGAFTTASSSATSGSGMGGATSASSAGGSTSMTTGAGGAGGVGGGLPQVLFPLVVGKVWSYKVTAIGNGGACGAGNSDQKITKEEMLDGKQAFTVTSWCAGAGDGKFAAGTGDEVFYRYNNMWQTILSGTVSDGAEWTFQGLKYKWKKEGTVTVTAGKFDDCWSAVRGDIATVYDTYCRGVGAVRHHNEQGGNGFDAELTAVK
jgi:hypothetical protein